MMLVSLLRWLELTASLTSAVSLGMCRIPGAAHHR
jgi:hypothetical protein